MTDVDEIFKSYQELEGLIALQEKYKDYLTQEDKKKILKRKKNLKNIDLREFNKLQQTKKKIILPERKNLLKKFEQFKHKIEDNELKKKINNIDLRYYIPKTSEFENVESQIQESQNTKPLLTEYKSLVKKQEKKNDELKNMIKQLDSSNNAIENKRVKIVQYSLYLGFLCLTLMVILNTFILKSKNRRKKLTGSTNIVDKVLFSLSFVSFISYLIHLNIRKRLIDLNIITITYALILILMVLIHQKKIVDVEEFTKKDKKNFMILISIKLALLFLLFVYLFLTTRIYKDTLSLQNFIKDAITKEVKNSFKKDLLKSISMIVTTVVGIVVANTFQYLD